MSTADTDRDSSPGFEREDVSGRGAAWFGIVFVVVTVVLVAVVTIFGQAVWKLGPDQTESAPGQQEVVGAPPLQANPSADLETYRARSRERLNSFGWVDRDRRIAHLPIGEAMRLEAGGGAKEPGR